MKKIPFSILTLLCFTCISCNSGRETPNISARDTISKTDCKPYFEFDNIEHYFIDKTDHDYMLLATKKKPSPTDLLLMEILSDGVFTSISDSIVIKDFEKIGYTKTNIDSKLNDEITEVFCERKHDSIVMAACMPLYRNIFVFKHRNKTVGIAKICFMCMSSNIVGTKLNTEEFGQSGDFDKLTSILRKSRAH